MSNRRKLPRPRMPNGLPTDALGFAQLFRRECTDCGFSGLQWDTGAGVDPAALGRLVPPDLIGSDLSDVAVWSCPRCGEGGAFFPPESG